MFASIGTWTGFVLWTLLLVAASLTIYLGLSGNWFVLGLALLHALLTGFDPIGWQLLLILLGMALVGEGLEFVLGTFYAARKGATSGGVVLAFVGGLIGAIVGNSLLPVIGAVFGSFAGAFLGAVAGEFRRQKRLEPSLRIGSHAFVGRVLAMLAKHAASLVMVVLIARATLPR
ncbi:MAG: DUF456 domain-containing protein [Candidatus Krumholzibacteriia bacterium]